MVPDPSVTQLLDRARSGSQSAIDALLPVVYGELRAIAQRHLRMEAPGHTLQATALVHEAYVKLVAEREQTWHDRAHFFALAAQAIRRILVDHARAKKALKRGSGLRPITLDGAGVADEAPLEPVDLLALEDALTDLGALDAQQARIVELRFFGGLSMPEVAEVLGVSLRTAEGDWAMARSWLRVRMTSQGA